MDEDRWGIQWVREYRQFVVNPPVDFFSPEDDFWESLSFNSIAEAMGWIEQQLIAQPVQDSLVQAAATAPVILLEENSPYVPPYQPRRETAEEPPRVLHDSERARANRYGVVNPIAEQIGNSETRRNRLADYEQSVGLN